jgi:hypothetical protein
MSDEDGTEPTDDENAALAKQSVSELADSRGILTTARECDEEHGDLESSEPFTDVIQQPDGGSHEFTIERSVVESLDGYVDEVANSAPLRTGEQSHEADPDRAVPTHRRDLWNGPSPGDRLGVREASRRGARPRGGGDHTATSRSRGHTGRTAHRSLALRTAVRS